MNNTIFLTLIFLFPFFINAQQSEKNKSWLSTAKHATLTGAEIYAINLGIAITATYAHEYGHAWAAQFLFKEPAQVRVYMHWFPLFISGKTSYHHTGAPEFIKSKDLLVALAGPLAGLAACWGMLKAHTFINCYLKKRNKIEKELSNQNHYSAKDIFLKEGLSALTALRKTMTQALINRHQSYIFKSGVLLASCADFMSLIPYSTNDGNAIVKNITGEHFKGKSPFLTDCIRGAALFGWNAMWAGHILASQWDKQKRKEKKS